VVGSVPAAFTGVILIRSFGDGEAVQNHIKMALGAALLLAVGTMVARAFLNVRQWSAQRRSGGDATSGTRGRDCPLVIRTLATVLVGALGGLVVGMTSVGSGSLIIVTLLVLYPRLTAAELVGTDLVQAVPLVGSAALGHLLFGEFHLGLTTSLLAGSLPGVYLGAKLSAVAPGGVVRRALALVLTASALKLLGAGNAQLLLVLAAAAVAGPLGWRWLRSLHGLPAQRLGLRVSS